MIRGHRIFVRSATRMVDYTWYELDRDLDRDVVTPLAGEPDVWSKLGDPLRSGGPGLGLGFEGSRIACVLTGIPSMRLRQTAVINDSFILLHEGRVSEWQKGLSWGFLTTAPPVDRDRWTDEARRVFGGLSGALDEDSSSGYGLTVDRSRLEEALDEIGRSVDSVRSSTESSDMSPGVYLDDVSAREGLLARLAGWLSGERRMPSDRTLAVVTYGVEPAALEEAAVWVLTSHPLAKPYTDIGSEGPVQREEDKRASEETVVLPAHGRPSDRPVPHKEEERHPESFRHLLAQGLRWVADQLDGEEKSGS